MTILGTVCGVIQDEDGMFWMRVQHDDKALHFESRIRISREQFHAIEMNKKIVIELLPYERLPAVA